MTASGACAEGAIMASPKDGTGVTPEAPEDPTAPLEATSTDPGELSEIAARNRSIEESKVDSTPSDAMAPPSAGGDSEPPIKLSWIGVELQDSDGKAVVNEPFVITFSNSNTSDGVTGPDGKSKIEGVPSGAVKIDFVSIDKREWSKK
jgi:hypothetical protein